MAFHLCLSNSLEKLADEFYTRLCVPMNKCADPFAGIHTVVANGGMGTFLKRHLARRNRLGIAANIECSFLQKFISDEMGKYFVPARREEFKNSIAFWSPEVLSWQIDLILEKEQGSFPDYTFYWNGDPMKRHLLSCELAQCFDRYQLYRSSCTGKSAGQLTAWRNGADDSSQARLYKKLYDQTPDPDSFYIEFFQTAAPLAVPAEKTGVFGIGSMSALHLNCLKKLAEHCDITLFCPSPCQVYWGDSRSRREILKEIKQDPSSAAARLDDSVSQNQLLADLGIPGREFFNLLLDEDCYTGEEEDLYCDPAPEGKGNALQLFQSDILNARARSKENAYTIAAADDSLRINCCPNARRELEMLHDQLLELFYDKSEKIGDSKYKVKDALRPEDVIVMFPDINKAAPMIDAVFSSGPFKNQYAICDRSTAGQSQVIECFSRLLELPSGRCTSEEILELLEFECLSAKLGIKTEDLPAITDIVSRFRISWGLDGKEHEKFRQNDFTEYSWQDGIDRFLTEYARGEDAGTIYAQYDTGGIDGEKAELFAIAAAFTAKLKEWRDQLFIPRTPAAWGEFMYGWINTFFSGTSKDYLPELSALRLAVAKIIRSSSAADEKRESAPEVFISRLKSEYSLAGGKQHFLRDKITFCSLVPLRAVPAKVIAVLGLNDGEFPRAHTPKSFDLLKEIQRNDPNSANDGRYLFLEALMAARENLILSYVGYDDGQELAPAIPMVAVETLLKEGFGIKKYKVPLKSLQLPSLSGKLRKTDEEEQKTDLPADIPAPQPYPERMTLHTLHEILTQNCEAFFKLRCGFDHDPEEKAVLMTDDPDSLSPLDNANLLRALWNMRLDGIPQEEWRLPVEKARILPICSQPFLDSAAAHLDETADTLTKIAPDIMEDLKAETALECSCDLTVPVSSGVHKITLSSRIVLPANWEQAKRRTSLRFSSVTSEKLLNFYLEHLLLTAAGPEDISEAIVFVTKENKTRVTKCYYAPEISQGNAVNELTSLMKIALRTCTEDKPLPLFAEASLAEAEYAIEKESSSDPDALESQAPKAFAQKDMKKHSVIERFYSEEDFCRGEFEQLAKDVYIPVAKIKRGKK